MLANRSLLTVGAVGERHGLTPRTLQRLFTHYVGVGPKWVLARYRMHDAVTDIDDGYAGTFTDLAHRYGWYDQAHFIRDFTALVGVTPGQYRDRAAG
jgi:AraC-like DNA-binding protein